MQFRAINTILSALFLNSLIRSTPIEEVGTIDAKDPSSLQQTLNNLNNTLFPTEECLTDECYETSKRVLTNIDISVDPCEDFFQFSCGGWIRDHPLEKGQETINSRKLTNLENVIMIRNILKGDYKPNDKYSPEEQQYDENTFKKLKDVYNTCMDVDAINKKGSQPMLDLLHHLRIFENRKRYATVEGLTDLIIRLHERSVPFLFDGTNVPYKGTDIYHFAFVENSSRLAVNLIKHRNEYKKYIHDTLELIFSGKGNRNIEEMTESIVNFENELYLATKNTDKKKYQKGFMTIKELHETYPFFDWKMYLERTLQLHNINEPVTLDTKVLNYAPHYFAALDDVMWKFSLDQLAYYVEWSVIRSFVFNLSDTIRQPEYEYKISIGGSPSDPIPREEFCQTKIEEMMGMIVGKYFVENIFTENDKTRASSTISYIKQAMVNRIPQMTWLDDQTKEKAIEKVLKMVDRIGYPDYLMNPSKLAEDYEDFETSDDDYFTNMINYDYYTTSNNIKLYHKPSTVDRYGNNWHLTPQTINAYYSMTDNSMNFPAGIFQSPYYRSSDPDYMNYGGIGMVAGHELTHGFDNKGRKYDSDGNRKNWWTNESSAKFEELSQCFIQQYSEFSVTLEDGSKVYCNGEKGLAENLADNGGIARSYEAWVLSIENAMKTNPELVKERNPLLPGLSDYSFEQLFYISYAQGWCTNATPSYLAKQMTTDVHSPAKFRVNGVVMNSEHFAKVFHCPAESAMNPKDKCSIW